MVIYPLNSVLVVVVLVVVVVQLVLPFADKILLNPYKHSTSGRPVGRQRLAATGQPAGSHPLVAQGWVARWATGGPPAAGRHLVYSFFLLPTSVPTDVLLHWFWPQTADLKPPLSSQ